MVSLFFWGYFIVCNYFSTTILKIKEITAFISTVKRTWIISPGTITFTWQFPPWCGETLTRLFVMLTNVNFDKQHMPWGWHISSRPTSWHVWFYARYPRGVCVFLPCSFSPGFLSSSLPTENTCKSGNCIVIKWRFLGLREQKRCHGDKWLFPLSSILNGGYLLWRFER